MSDPTPPTAAREQLSESDLPEGATYSIESGVRMSSFVYMTGWLDGRSLWISSLHEAERTTEAGRLLGERDISRAAVIAELRKRGQWRETACTCDTRHAGEPCPTHGFMAFPRTGSTADDPAPSPAPATQGSEMTYVELRASHADLLAALKVARGYVADSVPTNPSESEHQESTIALIDRALAPH